MRPTPTYNFCSSGDGNVIRSMSDSNGLGAVFRGSSCYGRNSRRESLNRPSYKDSNTIQPCCTYVTGSLHEAVSILCGIVRGL